MYDGTDIFYFGSCKCVGKSGVLRELGVLTKTGQKICKKNTINCELRGFT